MKLKGFTSRCLGARAATTGQKLNASIQKTTTSVE